MKNVLLCLLALTIAYTGYSQKQSQLRKDVPMTKYIQAQQSVDQPVKYEPITSSKVAAPAHYQGNRDAKIVNVLSIGTGPNGFSYGYHGGQNAILDADNDLNTVIHLHRMGGTLDPGGYSGDLGYDISTDGGINFTNMVECYTAALPGGQYYLDAARYPNFGIFNPEGNMDPNNAYVTYFAPILDNSNTNSEPGWGGYAHGRARIGDVADTIRHLTASTPPFYQYTPNAYDVSDAGICIGVDANVDWTGASAVYQGNLIVTRGVWEEGIGDFVWDRSLIDFPTNATNDLPAHIKFAFGPDGQTGYIFVISDNQSFEPIPGWDSIYFYPILLKTTDGGLNWSEPIPVRLDGPEGIPAIKDFLTDSQMDSLFTSWDRDEIPYCTGFDGDITVDAWGNPHVAVMVGVGHPSGSYSLITEPFFFAAFDIFSPDGGETWDAYKCGNVRFFRYKYGSTDADYEDNRTQITSTQDGDKVFVTWTDTRLSNATDNRSPDIFVRGIDVNSGEPWRYTLRQDGEDSATNVTEFSEAMWTSNWAITSRTTFDDNGTYTVPFTYMVNNTPFDMNVAVQYKYVQNFSFTDADFLITDVKETENTNLTAVSQNYPNPFSNTSTIQVNLERKASLKMVVSNILGQQVMEINRGEVPAGTHQFEIDGSKLGNGIYFYTVTAGQESMTRKMIVE
jgi:hypothetical protein